MALFFFVLALFSIARCRRTLLYLASKYGSKEKLMVVSSGLTYETGLPEKNEAFEALFYQFLSCMKKALW